MSSKLPSPCVLALLASARGDGETGALIRELMNRAHGSGLIDLGAHRIAPYDYDGRYGEDDFAAIAKHMGEAQTIVLASPVYWYSMSAPMKIFFDRLTDLTGAHKSLGKALAGKTMFLVGSGSAPQAPASFIDPFRKTADYFNMSWGGALYGESGKPDEDALDAFARKISSRAKEAAHV